MARIIVKRDQLKSIHSYAATLLHETAHARSGASDVTEDFETELTTLLASSRRTDFNRRALRSD